MNEITVTVNLSKDDRALLNELKALLQDFNARIPVQPGVRVHANGMVTFSTDSTGKAPMVEDEHNFLPGLVTEVEP